MKRISRYDVDGDPSPGALRRTDTGDRGRRSATEDLACDFRPGRRAMLAEESSDMAFDALHFQIGE
jgi:hypothetical protein